MHHPSQSPRLKTLIHDLFDDYVRREAIDIIDEVVDHASVHHVSHYVNMLWKGFMTHEKEKKVREISYLLDALQSVPCLVQWSIASNALVEQGISRFHPQWAKEVLPHALSSSLTPSLQNTWEVFVNTMSMEEMFEVTSYVAGIKQSKTWTSEKISALKSWWLSTLESAPLDKAQAVMVWDDLETSRKEYLEKNFEEFKFFLDRAHLKEKITLPATIGTSRKL